MTSLQNHQKESDGDKSRTCTGLLKSYHGIAYQVQWLMLVALEAKNCGAVSGFTFKTEVDYDDSGKFDDVVWQYIENDTFKYNFLQAKHKLKLSERITMEDLLRKKTETKHNPFGLQKYYISYMDCIKNNYKYQNGIIENLIIATNIDLDDDLKNNFEPKENVNPVLNISREDEDDQSTTCWKINNNVDQRKIIEILEDTYDLIKLAKNLEEDIFKQQNLVLLEELQVYSDSIYKNVFNCEGSKICNDFIDNKNLPKETEFLRESFFHEAFTKKRKLLCVQKDSQIYIPDKFAEYVAGKIVNAHNKVVKIIKSKNHKENVKKLANFVLIKKDGIKFNPRFWTSHDIDMPNDTFKNFRYSLKNKLQTSGVLDLNDTCAEVVTKLDDYRFEIAHFKTCRIHLIDENSFWDVVRDYKSSSTNNSYRNVNFSKKLPNYSLYDVNENIHKFLDILVFAVNYTKNYLHRVVRDNLKQNLKWIDNEYTAYAFRTEIANTLDLTEDKFISTAEDVVRFFDKLKEKTNQLILLGPTLEYCSKIDFFNIHFQPYIINEQSLHTFINNELEDIKSRQEIKENENLSTKQVYCIKTDQNILSSIKVFHILNNIPKYSTQYNYIFMRLESIIFLQDFVMQVFEKTVNLLVIECDVKNKQSSISNICKKITGILHSDINKKVLLIAQSNDYLTVNLKNELKNKYYEIFDSEISLSSLGENTQLDILQRGEIVFQGKDISLYKLVNESKHLIDSQILCQLLKHDTLEICNTFPNLDEIESFYVQRELICRKKVSTEIIKESSDDLIVFSNTEETELMKLAFQYKVDTQKIRKYNEIDFKNDNGLKFIILNELLDEYQYSQLCKICHQNVHWIVKERNYFKWRQTKGVLTNIRPYLEVRRYYKENNELDNKNEIINDLKNDRIIIIAAEPGMGKSTMITHLALRIKQIDPSIWIVVIDLRKYRTPLKKIKLNDEYSAMEFLYTTVGFKVLSENIKETIRKKTLSWLIKNTNTAELPEELNLKGVGLLEIGIFKNKLFKSNEVHIFFDGFDEICPKFEDEVIYLINVLKNATLAKLWITSRTYNIINKLEDNMGTFSYSIKPFDIKEQEFFLLKFWKSCLKVNELDEQRSRIFIDELLAQFSKVTNDTKRTFVGIPLQIRMLAQNRLMMFKEFYESGVLQLNNQYKLNINKELNLVNLYEEFINIKFEIRFKEKKDYWPSDDEEIEEMIQKKRKELYIEHQILSVYALYTDLEKLFPEQLKGTALSILPKHRNATDKNAIIDRVIDDSPIFVHQTYAEYFAALFLWNKFKTIPLDEFHKDFLFKMLRGDFFLDDRIQVCNFFYFIADKTLKESDQSEFIHKEDKITSTLKQLVPIIQNMYTSYENTGNDLEDGTDDLQYVCLPLEGNIYVEKPNYVQVVKSIFLIVESYLSLNNSNNLAIINVIINDDSINLLRMASEIGCLNFVKTYLDKKDYNYKKSIEYSKWYFTPLWLAAKNGHLDALRYLSHIIDHNWIDKDKLTLTQRAYYVPEVKVIKNCLTLNILDANPFLDFNQRQNLPIVIALGNVWPSDVIELLIRKTDARIFNEFMVECTNLKASFEISTDLLKYDISITNSIIEKGINFFGVINILLYQYRRSSLIGPINLLRRAKRDREEINRWNGLPSFHTDQEYLKLYELIVTFLMSGIGYNNLDAYEITTIQYSKEIYYFHKLFQNMSNNNICSTSLLDTLLKLIIDTVANTVNDFRITKDSDDLLFLMDKYPKAIDGPITDQYKRVMWLIPTSCSEIFNYLKNSIKVISSNLDNLKSYLGTAKIEIEQFKMYRDSKKYENILTGYERMLECYSLEVKISKQKHLQSLPYFERYIFKRILTLYIRQNYEINEALNEVSSHIWKYKKIRDWMDGKPELCIISREEIIDVLGLHCADSCQSESNKQRNELTTNILHCGGLHQLYQIWSELSFIGEKNLVHTFKSMSQYVHISSQIFDLLNRLDQSYKKLTEAVKTKVSQNIYEVLKTIENCYIKAVINGQDGEYGSPLHYAAFIGDIQMVEIFLKHGADPNQPLVAHGKLICCGNNDDDDDDDDDEDHCIGYTALHVATKKVHLDIIQLLLKYKANSCIKTCNGKTAQNLAQESFKNNPETYQIIINVLNNASTADQRECLDLPSKVVKEKLSPRNEGGKKRTHNPCIIRQDSDEATSYKQLKKE